MNILLIGNGFDLAHGLPTKYENFLDWVQVIKQIINIKGKDDLDKINWESVHPQIKTMLEENMGHKKMDNLFSQREMWLKLVVDNFWIDYFLQCDMYQRENWIDFEQEISRVIKQLDEDIGKAELQNNVISSKISEDFVRNYFCVDTEKLAQEREDAIYEQLKYENLTMVDRAEYSQKYREEHPIKASDSVTYEEIITRLKKDLDNLIYALEIYLRDYVERMEIECYSPDIQECLLQYRENNGIKSVLLSKLISFNYTHICNKVYQTQFTKQNGKTNYDYIHGETKSDGAGINNMVLGIDEYLSKKRKNKDIRFIEFKKYFQRIYKRTGSEYKIWIDEIVHKRTKVEQEIRHQYRITGQIPYDYYLGEYRHELYIFGHSLDITDGDILRSLILNDNVKTTIFYYNEEAHVKQIANLVKIIGQDELIQRTGGSTQTIEFKQQKNMEKR